MTTPEIMVRVLTRLPYVYEVIDNDASGRDCYRFTWRNTRFQVDSSLAVEEVVGDSLAATDAAILLQALLTYPEETPR